MCLSGSAPHPAIPWPSPSSPLPAQPTRPSGACGCCCRCTPPTARRPTARCRAARSCAPSAGGRPRGRKTSAAPRTEPCCASSTADEGAKRTHASWRRASAAQRALLPPASCGADEVPTPPCPFALPVTGAASRPLAPELLRTFLPTHDPSFSTPPPDPSSLPLILAPTPTPHPRRRLPGPPPPPSLAGMPGAALATHAARQRQQPPCLLPACCLRHRVH